jgi:hypothetical protein
MVVLFGEILHGMFLRMIYLRDLFQYFTKFINVFLSTGW